MQDQILFEIRLLKEAIVRLIGTSENPPHEQFAIDSIDKAAKQFQKLSIERGEWVEDHEISKYIKGAPYRAGAFIRQEFSFANYFKRGATHYYNKKDLIALSKELKERNVDLKRYMEYVEDESKFKKYLLAAIENKKGKRKPFQLSVDLKDIVTSAPPSPAAEIVRKDIQSLKDEFFKEKLAPYIDIYRGNHAMMKFVYHFDKYLDPTIKGRCKKWCDNFNYANEALALVTKKKEPFIPIAEEDRFEL